MISAAFGVKETARSMLTIMAALLKKHFTKIFNQRYDNTSYYIENNALTVCINVAESKRIAAGYTDRKFIVEV